jgi:hypothetical protein
MEGLVNEQEQQQQQASQQQEQEGGGGGHGGGGGYPTKQRPPPAITAVAVPQRPPVRTLKARRAYYTRADLEPFNLLEHPVWVFDIERKCMWWANDAALVVWNAPTLDALLARSFSDDMSQATTLRLSDYLRRFREHDEKIAESVCFAHMSMSMSCKESIGCVGLACSCAVFFVLFFKKRSVCVCVLGKRWHNLIENEYAGKKPRIGL